MTTHDEQLALELDAFLTAQLQQRPLPAISEELQAEAQLALALREMAQAQEPDPIFLSALEAQLATAASRQTQAKKKPEQAKRPFWTNLIMTIKETFTMKRTIYALGGLTAVLVIGVFIWFGLNRPASEPDLVADIGPGAVVETPETAAPEDTAVPGEAATPDQSNLPKLPALGQSGGMGLGGGGGAGGGDGTVARPAEEMAVMEGDMMIVDPFIWNPLADAQYNVTAPFPTDPSAASVYQQNATNLFTIEEIQRYAQLFGLNGPVYTEVFAEPVYDVPEGEVISIMPWTPPTLYYVFDGDRQLSFYETNIYYFDLAASQNYTMEMMPFAQALPIAETFLQERGLLNFPYEARSPWGGDVQFFRIINGYVNATAEIYVSVSTNGEIMSISYQPFDKLELVGDYPLRPAAEAWQEVLDEGFDYMRRYWYTYPSPDAIRPEEGIYEPAAPWEELYKYWNRTYNDGDPITLISYPLVYLAVTGDAAPRIMVDQYRLSGAAADLEALAEYAGQPVRIEGILRGQLPNATIELTGWQPEPNQMWQYMSGAIRFDGTQVLFDADEGETFVVPNPPADLSDGERVNLSGWNIERGEGAYRVFNWASMDRIINWEEFENDFVEPMPYEPGEEYKITDVTIDKIELIYQFSPVFTEERGVTNFILQPAWRFSGSTNTNELIEIVVQAVPSEFVE